MRGCNHGLSPHSSDDKVQLVSAESARFLRDISEGSWGEPSEGRKSSSRSFAVELCAAKLQWGVLPRDVRGTTRLKSRWNRCRRIGRTLYGQVQKHMPCPPTRPFSRPLRVWGYAVRSSDLNATGKPTVLRQQPLRRLHSTGAATQAAAAPASFFASLV